MQYIAADVTPGPWTRFFFHAMALNGNVLVLVHFSLRSFVDTRTFLTQSTSLNFANSRKAAVLNLTMELMLASLRDMLNC